MLQELLQTSGVLLFPFKSGQQGFVAAILDPCQSRILSNYFAVGWVSENDTNNLGRLEEKSYGLLF